MGLYGVMHLDHVSLRVTRELSAISLSTPLGSVTDIGTLSSDAETGCVA